jgi:pyruvate/2-oxoglutarate dehydrogenase complex dihydrolipoamide acyltransferase (E2) component
VAEDVILPKTGLQQGDATLVGWLVAEGAQVQEGEPLFTMATDKVEMDVEAVTSGWLRQVVTDDTTLSVGSRVGIIAATAEEYAAIAGEQEQHDPAQH